MALGQHRHYEPLRPTAGGIENDDPLSSPAAFVAALALLLLMGLVVVLLWAPWSGAGDTSSTTPTQAQPALNQPLPQEGIQLAPNAPRDAGSSSRR